MRHGNWGTEKAHPSTLLRESIQTLPPRFPTPIPSLAPYRAPLVSPTQLCIHVSYGAFIHRTGTAKSSFLKALDVTYRTEANRTQAGSSSLATGLRAQEAQQRVVWVLWGVLFCFASDAAQMHQKKIQKQPQKKLVLSGWSTKKGAAQQKGNF